PLPANYSRRKPTCLCIARLPFPRSGTTCRRDVAHGAMLRTSLSPLGDTELGRPLLRHEKGQRQEKLQGLLTIIAVEHDIACQDRLFPRGGFVFLSPLREKIDDGRLTVEASSVGDLWSCHDCSEQSLSHHAV